MSAFNTATAFFTMLTKESMGPIGELQRRDFIKGSILLLLSAILGEAWYLNRKWDIEMDKLRDDWKEAHSYKSAEEFIRKNKKWLQHVRLGFNISPETLDWAYRDNRDDAYEGATKPAPEQLVRQMIEEFGLRSARLGIRMDRCLDVATDTINLDYYKPILDVLAELGVDTYQAIGQKVPRWPEMHSPQEILKRFYGEEIPGPGHEITPEDPFGQYLLGVYYPRVCEALLKLAKDGKYPPNIFFCIQPENEPLSEFGELKWKLSEEFVLQAIAIAHRYFPTSNIMQNSPIAWGQFRKINKVLIEALQRIPSLKGKLFSAVNNYFRQPHFKMITMKADGEELFENMAFANVASQVHGDVEVQLELLRTFGIKVMVSELAMEPWDPYLTPGNDFHEYIFALLRAKRMLTIPRTGVIDVLNWGMEEFAYSLGNEHNPHRWHHQEMIALWRGVFELQRKARSGR